MPRINTATLSEHRDWRRNQLIAAASAIALEQGGQAVTVAAVAERAGLSRTSVYEYFGSSAELVADLVIDELTVFAQSLQGAVALTSDPYDAIDAWIDAALRYIADGRH
ncbi:MAG: TetR family transcriptional regulator, partial [Actinobacteria bacterium]|nr:TetR family transcriptional regulator [Actinomycetota bacterium]